MDIARRMSRAIGEDNGQLELFYDGGVSPSQRALKEIGNINDD